MEIVNLDRKKISLKKQKQKKTPYLNKYGYSEIHLSTPSPFFRWKCSEMDGLAQALRIL